MATRRPVIDSDVRLYNQVARDRVRGGELLTRFEDNGDGSGVQLVEWPEAILGPLPSREELDHARLHADYREQDSDVDLLTRLRDIEVRLDNLESSR